MPHTLVKSTPTRSSRHKGDPSLTAFSSHLLSTSPSTARGFKHFFHTVTAPGTIKGKDKSRGQGSGPTVELVDKVDVFQSKRKPSLLRRHLQGGSRKAGAQALKSTSAPCALTPTSSPNSAATLKPPSVLPPTKKPSTSFITPSLSRASLSTPAVHMSSDPMEGSPIKMASSKTVDALVSPPRKSIRVPAATGRPRVQSATYEPASNKKSPQLPLTSSLSSEAKLNSSTATRHSASPPVVGSASSTPKRPAPSPVAQSTPTRSAPLVPLAASSPFNLPSIPSGILKSPLKHARATSSPISTSRQAIRLAASFIIRETGRFVTPNVKMKKEVGWYECESRLGALRRMERNWGILGAREGNGGEERERRVFWGALGDGVVLCFLLNRLFPVTLQPPLCPNSKSDPVSINVNITQFLSALPALGILPFHYFHPLDLSSDHATADGLYRVANTILKLLEVEVDAPCTPTLGKTRLRPRPVSPRQVTPPPSPSARIAVAMVAAQSQGLDVAHEGIVSIPEDLPVSTSTSSSPTSSSESESASPTSSNTLPKIHILPNNSLSIRHPTIEEASPNAELRTNPITNALYSSPELLCLAVEEPRPETPSLVSDNEKRGSIDSGTSGSISHSSGSAFSINLGPLVEIVPSTYPVNAEEDPASSPTASTPGLELVLGKRADSLPQGLTKRGKVEMDRLRPPVIPRSSSNASDVVSRTLSSGLRPSSPSHGRVDLPIGVRRVSPSNVSRSPSLARVVGSPSKGGSETPRRHVLKRGTSVDASGSSSLSTSRPSTPSILDRPSTPLLIETSDRTTTRKLRRHSTQVCSDQRPTVIPQKISSRSNVQLSSTLEPQKLTSANLHGSALQFSPSSIETFNLSNPPTPRNTRFSATQPPSPPQVAHPEFKNRPPPLAHDSYTRPPSFRTTKFADEIQDPRSHVSDEGGSMATTRSAAIDIPKKEGAKEIKSGLDYMDGGGRNASSTSLGGGKGQSALRQILTVKEAGKAAVNYSLGNCIGKGQFGTVYRALNLATGEMAAIKRIRLEGLKEDDITQLMKEVDLLKRLAHPSIVKYEGMMRDEDTLNIVLEYVENGSLGSTLKSFGKLNEKLVASYVIKILEGLYYLHSQKVVHCDLKAANILTTKTGNVKLTDFGVSLSLVAVEQEKENDVAGTPNWMAPEVIQMQGASTASDIWSLGCTIIELLTGRPPFAEISNGMAVMYRIVEGEPPEVPDGCSNALRAFLSQCFEKDPTMRPTADILFEHVWLQEQFGFNKRSNQDSIPFLRRVSVDVALIAERNRRISLPANRKPYTSEFNNSGSILLDDWDAPLAASFQRPGYLSRQPTSSTEVPTSRFAASTDDFPPQAHMFVKTTFSKPVTCKVCLLAVKRSAVLCESCTLICHASCVKEAPNSCDVGAQILLSAQRSNQLRHETYAQASSFPFPDPVAITAPRPDATLLSSSPSNRTFSNWIRSRSPTSFSARPSKASVDLTPAPSRTAFGGFANTRQNEDRPLSRQSVRKTSGPVPTLHSFASGGDANPKLSRRTSQASGVIKGVLDDQMDEPVLVVFPESTSFGLPDSVAFGEAADHGFQSLASGVRKSKTGRHTDCVVM